MLHNSVIFTSKSPFPFAPPDFNYTSLNLNFVEFIECGLKHIFMLFHSIALSTSDWLCQTSWKKG